MRGGWFAGLVPAPVLDPFLGLVLVQPASALAEGDSSLYDMLPVVVELNFCVLSL